MLLTTYTTGPSKQNHDIPLTAAIGAGYHLVIYKQKRAYTMGGGLGKGRTIPLFQWLINVLHFLFPKYKQFVFEWDKTNAKHPIHTPHKYITNTRHDIVTHKNGRISSNGWLTYMYYCYT